MSFGLAFAFFIAARATANCDEMISIGSCSTQPGFGKMLLELLLRDGLEPAVVIDKDGAGRRRALIECEDVAPWCGLLQPRCIRQW